MDLKLNWIVYGDNIKNDLEVCVEKQILIILVSKACYSVYNENHRFTHGL